MDQSRLEELKRLLNERRGGAKQNRSEELSVENSETENFESLTSEIQNSEVSNFEARNSEASNFKAQNSEVSNSKFLNYKSSDSEVSNSESMNSKAPNFATDALNLETEAAQNSAFENSVEPQNFISDDSGSLRQNSKVRDYDKYPLVIKDHTY